MLATAGSARRKAGELQLAASASSCSRANDTKLHGDSHTVYVCARSDRLMVCATGFCLVLGSGPEDEDWGRWDASEWFVWAIWEVCSRTEARQSGILRQVPAWLSRCFPPGPIAFRSVRAGVLLRLRSGETHDEPVDSRARLDLRARAVAAGAALAQPLPSSPGNIRRPPFPTAPVDSPRPCPACHGSDDTPPRIADRVSPRPGRSTVVIILVPPAKAAEAPGSIPAPRLRPRDLVPNRPRPPPSSVARAATSDARSRWDRTTSSPARAGARS
jgi:hypothetical protein